MSSIFSAIKAVPRLADSTSTHDFAHQVAKVRSCFCGEVPETLSCARPAPVSTRVLAVVMPENAACRLSQRPLPLESWQAQEPAW